uniref:Spermatogenesis-associated protein 6 n=1 Tax=Lygus hesperus TaxID=30085 RepID=A0A0A9XRB6_LYGHE
MSKLYNVSIYLDINTVSCPGVWLCPKGKAFLKICLFGVSDLTKEVDPFFPLIFKERFHFQKVFKNINSVYELHDKLGRSIISLELLQCPIGSAGCVKLALFNALLSDILHPYTTCFSKPLHTSGLELLFTTCKVFPGIIAPKADVSTKVMVTDTLDGGRSMKMQGMRSRSVNDDEKKRQHKVCHTKNNTNCRCFQAQVGSIEDLNEYRAVEPAESEASQESVPHDIKVSGRRRTERDGIGREDNANVRTLKSVLEDQSRIPRIGREEGIASSDSRENVRKREIRRETVRPRTDRGDVGDINSFVSREDGVLSIAARGANRHTTVPEEHTSDRRSRVSKYDERIGEDHRYRGDMIGTSYGRSEDHVLGGGNVGPRIPGESRQKKENEDKYGLKNMTSCERFLQDHDFEEIQRTNDQLLREKYFRCYKEGRADGQAPSNIDRGRGETN